MNTKLTKLLTLMTAAALMAVVICSVIFIITLTAAPVNQITTNIIAGSVYGLGFFGVLFILCVLILLRIEAI